MSITSGTARAGGAASGTGLGTAAAGVLEQCAALVAALPDAAYTGPSRVLPGGTIGKHVRHTLDHFRAALDAAEDGGVIDYDHRLRNVPLEADRVAALAAIRAAAARLAGLDQGVLGRAVLVRAMLCEDGSCAELGSTLGRELAFAMHHAIHHQAMIGAIAAEFGFDTGNGFGKAPSTLNHERGG